MNPQPVSSHPQSLPLVSEEPRVSLEDVLLAAPDVAARPCQPGGPICGVMIGRLTAVEADGSCRVDLEGSDVSEPLAARSAAPLADDDVGREVALAFERGNPASPIVLGVIQHLRQSSAPAQSAAPLEATVDGRRVVITAEQEIVLRCGKASILLTADGNVLIRGAYVVSRASGTNRIRGGNVQIN